MGVGLALASAELADCLSGRPCSDALPLRRCQAHLPTPSAPASAPLVVGRGHHRRYRGPPGSSTAMASCIAAQGAFHSPDLGSGAENRAARHPAIPLLCHDGILPQPARRRPACWITSKRDQAEVVRWAARAIPPTMAASPWVFDAATTGMARQPAAGRNLRPVADPAGGHGPCWGADRIAHSSGGVGMRRPPRLGHPQPGSPGRCAGRRYPVCLVRPAAPVGPVQRPARAYLLCPWALPGVKHAPKRAPRSPNPERKPMSDVHGITTVATVEDVWFRFTAGSGQPGSCTSVSPVHIDLVGGRAGTPGGGYKVLVPHHGVGELRFAAVSPRQKRYSDLPRGFLPRPDPDEAPGAAAAASGAGGPGISVCRRARPGRPAEVGRQRHGAITGSAAAAGGGFRLWPGGPMSAPACLLALLAHFQRADGARPGPRITTPGSPGPGGPLPQGAYQLVITTGGR